MQFLNLLSFSAERRHAILDRVHGRVTMVQARMGVNSQTAGSNAIIPLMGEIWRRSGTFQPFVTDIDEFRAAVNTAAADAKTERILLTIDSPGGTVDGLKEAADAVAAANRVKPVTAVIEGTGASAAYYLASQAGRVLAGPMDLVGSIGTIIVIADASKMAENAGIRVIPIESGKFKHTGTLGVEVTPEEIAYLQGINDAYAADFKAAVGRGRRMSAERIADVADGRVFLASEALKLGLIDGLGAIGDVLGAFAGQDRVRATRTEISILDLTTPKT